MQISLVYISYSLRTLNDLVRKEVFHLDQANFIGKSFLSSVSLLLLLRLISFATGETYETLNG